MPPELPPELIEQHNCANAEQAVSIAIGHKWPVPDRFATVQGRHREAFRLSKLGPPTTPNLPDDEKKLETVLREHAANLATHRVMTEVAEETAASRTGYDRRGQVRAARMV